MADEPVSCEPVSRRISLLAGKNAGKIRFLTCLLARLRPVILADTELEWHDAPENVILGQHDISSELSHGLVGFFLEPQQAYDFAKFVEYSLIRRFEAETFPQAASMTVVMDNVVAL